METVLPARVRVCLPIWSISAGSLYELYVIKVFVQRASVLCAVISFYGTRICSNDVTVADENRNSRLDLVFVTKKTFFSRKRSFGAINLFIKKESKVKLENCTVPGQFSFTRLKPGPDLTVFCGLRPDPNCFSAHLGRSVKAGPRL